MCPTCAPYADVHPGRVPALTGETREASFDPAYGSALDDESEGRQICVHSVNGEFVVAEGGTWLPGSYATEAGARRAAESFTYEVLHALQNRKNAEAGGTGGTITDADLDALADATARA